MKLCQNLATLKATKSRINRKVTDLHHTTKNPSFFHGQVRTFEVTSDRVGESPPEHQRVQFRAEDILRSVGEAMTELMDATAIQEWANTKARADVRVGDEVLIPQAPVTYLLFMEKQLTDLHTFVSKLPVLSPAEEWKYDDNDKLFKTPAQKTERTKKVQRPITMYEATKEHPAQTQLITEDIPVGFWNTVKHSGALPPSRKELLERRVADLLAAVKAAREEANMIQAEKQEIGQKVFDYIFK